MFYCNCLTRQNEQNVEKIEKFIAEFESYQFASRQLAQQNYNSLSQESLPEIKECIESFNTKLKKLNERYKDNLTKHSKFGKSYSDQLTLCNLNKEKFNSLTNQALAKIDLYVGPVDREKARQDSIAAAEAIKQQRKSDSINAAILSNSLSNSEIWQILDGFWLGPVRQNGISDPYKVEFISEKDRGFFRYSISKFECSGKCSIVGYTKTSIDFRQFATNKKNCADGGLVRLKMVGPKRLEVLLLTDTNEIVGRGELNKLSSP